MDPKDIIDFVYFDAALCDPSACLRRDIVTSMNKQVGEYNMILLHDSALGCVTHHTTLTYCHISYCKHQIASKPTQSTVYPETFQSIVN
jgi:hypothetical protein